MAEIYSGMLVSVRLTRLCGEENRKRRELLHEHVPQISYASCHCVTMRQIMWTTVTTLSLALSES